MALAQPEAPDPLLGVDLQRSLLTKASSVFAVSELSGDIDADASPETGVFFHDTRFLSRSLAWVNGERPRVRRASAWDGDRCQVDLEAGPLLMSRERKLQPDVAETFEILNSGPSACGVRLELEFAADFVSVFDVRGAPPRVRQPPQQRRLGRGRLRFVYLGADGQQRQTEIALNPAPRTLRAAIATYEWNLDPGQRARVEVRCRPRDDGPATLEPAPEGVGEVADSRFRVVTPHERFNSALRRSLQDLAMLRTRQQNATYFAAGVPWFVALFGRDSVITALQVLPFEPAVAAGTLRLLAFYQGRRHDPFRDEEPGKILHELRVSEDANLGEVPHTPYYGTVDATSLFVTLLAEYVRWTGDVALWAELRSSVRAAVEWIMRHGDHDGDGFLDYESRSPAGLDNQGWKDSRDAIVHRDGSLARPPIALVEAQAYAYRALRDAAWLHALDRDQAARQALEAGAQALRERFRRAYWMPRRHFLAVALSGGGRVESVTSNAGHALWAGILDEPDARAVGRRLLARDMFSGWGVRTLSAGERAYDPDGYQVGSIWPHDNSLVAAGLFRYGLAGEGLRVLRAQVDAASAFPGHRLPEVFCGHPRGRHQRPIPYPVACHPQAWSAGAIPYLLQAALGLRPDAPAGRLAAHNPQLPEWLPEVRLEQLPVGGAALDLRFYRDAGGKTRLEVEGAPRDMEVTVTDDAWYRGAPGWQRP